MICSIALGSCTDQQHANNVYQDCRNAIVIHMRPDSRHRYACPQGSYEKTPWYGPSKTNRCYLKRGNTGASGEYEFLSECKPLVEHVMRQKRRFYKTFSVRLMENKDRRIMIEVNGKDNFFFDRRTRITYITEPGAKIVRSEQNVQHSRAQVPPHGQPRGQPQDYQRQQSSGQSRGQSMESQEQQASEQRKKRGISNGDFMYIIAVVLALCMIGVVCALGVVAFVMIRQRRL